MRLLWRGGPGSVAVACPKPSSVSRATRRAWPIRTALHPADPDAPSPPTPRQPAEYTKYRKAPRKGSRRLPAKSAPMESLRQRILSEGKNLGRGILKVDGFINHQVDPVLMNECGRELARWFAHAGVTKVLTAEISGIAPALCAALTLGIPVKAAQRAG